MFGRFAFGLEGPRMVSAVRLADGFEHAVAARCGDRHGKSSRIPTEAAGVDRTRLIDLQHAVYRQRGTRQTEGQQRDPRTQRSSILHVRLTDSWQKRLKADRNFKGPFYTLGHVRDRLKRGHDRRNKTLQAQAP